MSRASDNADIWTWQRPIGQLRCGSLAGRVDVSRPRLGVHQLCLRGDALAGHVLGVAWQGLPDDRPARMADAYLRGGDVVANYQPQTDWPYAPQVYWRAEAAGPTGGALAALTLWVSVQTDLLDTCPHACIESQLPADELLHVHRADAPNPSAQPITGSCEWSAVDLLGTGCLVWRLPGGRLSCAQFARPGDVRGLQAESGAAPLGRWQLFADFLEKGVIRRACLQMVVLPRDDDVAQSTACYRAFQSRPLPLTT